MAATLAAFGAVKAKGECKEEQKISQTEQGN